MADKYAIKITDFFDTKGEGYEAYSYWYVSDNDEDETKVVLFDSESQANDFINSRIFNHTHAEAVIYSGLSINKKQLVDFIGKVNDQLALQDIVKEFCRSINLEIEITYKYAIYVYYARHLNKQNHLYTKKNNVVLFDTYDEAHRACSFFETDDTWAEVEVYQRIIKYDDTTIVYDIY